MDYTIGYLPHPEGDFNQNSAYTPMAVVHLNGESFISKVNVPAGIIPRVSTDWTNYWQVFAEGTQGLQGYTGARGDQGAQGYQGNQGATGTGTQGTQGYQGATGAGSTWWYTEDNLDDGKLPYKISDLKGPNTKVKEGDYILDLGGKVLVIDRIERTDITAWSVANNIKGADGAQGSQGTQGRDGAYAAQGIQGSQGAIGAQGTAPAHTEQFVFELEDGTTVTKTFYIV